MRCTVRLWEVFVSVTAHVELLGRHSTGSAVKVKAKDRSAGKVVLLLPHPISRIDPAMFPIMRYCAEKWFGCEKNAFCLQDKA